MKTVLTPDRVQCQQAPCGPQDREHNVLTCLQTGQQQQHTSHTVLHLRVARTLDFLLSHRYSCCFFCVSFRELAHVCHVY